ncbi:polysaccharide deacetylase family protein [Paenibacillus oleatilyticus]|uniref:polysaccharide deacetylase family protein n=1 Tax=Paenibacillus oleatilyticus TaxID=2594886 RepID=UPI0020A72FEF|nr:polysaccharide deacetylase family protein [Paenibacillus oleatilyticus]
MKPFVRALFALCLAMLASTLSLFPPANPPSAQAASSIRIPVLNYHSITVDPGNRATIAPDKFEEQMRYLADEGYTTLTLQQFTDILGGKEKPPEKPILLTFDDGYADNYEHAYPLLKKLKFNATLFMVPGFVGDGYYLDWEQVKAMKEAGWDIQPHSMSHPNLPKLSVKKQTYEITESRRLIEEQLGTTADIFCYPYGESNRTTLNLLKENKFRYAFTIDQGWASSDQDPLKLKRLFVNGEASMKAWKRLLEPSKS